MDPMGTGIFFSEITILKGFLQGWFTWKCGCGKGNKHPYPFQAEYLLGVCKGGFKSNLMQIYVLFRGICTPKKSVHCLGQIVPFIIIPAQEADCNISSVQIQKAIVSFSLFERVDLVGSQISQQKIGWFLVRVDKTQLMSGDFVGVLQNRWGKTPKRRNTLDERNPAPVDR